MAKESYPGQAAPEPEVEQKYYGQLEGIVPREEPGITITGTEQFNGEQGFIPAAHAEKSGVAVTGKDTADAPVADEPAPKEAAKKSAKKASRKGK